MSTQQDPRQPKTTDGSEPLPGPHFVANPVEPFQVDPGSSGPHPLRDPSLPARANESIGAAQERQADMEKIKQLVDGAAVPDKAPPPTAVILMECLGDILRVIHSLKNSTHNTQYIKIAINKLDEASLWMDVELDAIRRSRSK